MGYIDSFQNEVACVPIPVTVIVPTKNEEKAITSCLGSLVGRFEQVVVVDSHSSDRTQHLSAVAGAEVVDFVWNRRYPKKKQWCIDNLPLRHDWVLFVDADEVVSPTLLSEIESLAAASFHGCSAFDVPLAYAWQGTLLNHGQVVVKRALLNRGRVKFPILPDLDAPGMGEQEGHYQPQVSGRIGITKGKLLHIDPDPVGDWFSRHNRYSDWEAYLRVNPSARRAVRSVRSRQGQRLESLPFKPLVLFVYNYFFKLGLLDGREGFDYALALAFYHWQIGVKVRDLKRE